MIMYLIILYPYQNIISSLILKSLIDASIIFKIFCKKYRGENEMRRTCHSRLCMHQEYRQTIALPISDRMTLLAPIRISKPYLDLSSSSSIHQFIAERLSESPGDSLYNLRHLPIINPSASLSTLSLASAARQSAFG